ncbi:GNAT superfamily N-acetyltransferase [Deinococcus metalli]|uniref:GCN5 family acetyltransferase n=1 Tax=Deinococcus metalli TaxID=1141878 RepID=A0A7W8NS45_9DEIO|nr:GNAT family N-acetyltransferase [Deinococcus metalli]MBB5377598.1 GNAT superfamily N-acetyltransferase [Deinococcus metalli]GHF51971.1 GCN5 family acetyltransferase [Deinococcus metalli]
MTLDVRPVQEHEWDAAARAYSAAHPHEPLSGADLHKRQREQEDWGYGAATLAAAAGPEIVGVGAYFQNPGSYHPRRYTLDLGVLPERQGQGAGAALWAAVEAALRARDAESVRVLAREDHPVAPGFLARRGFVGDKRYFTSALDVAAFDPAPFAGTLAAVTAQGVEIRSLSELRAAGTPDLDARLHALMSDVRTDVPRSEPATPLSFQVFTEAVLGDPGLLPDAYLVAVYGEDFIGQTALFASEVSDLLFTGLTGVSAAWRGRGVATALKVAAARVARDRGAPTIRTDNASDNAPMLAVNGKLGFVRDPASVSYLKVF